MRAPARRRHLRSAYTSAELHSTPVGSSEAPARKRRSHSPHFERAAIWLRDSVVFGRISSLFRNAMNNNNNDGDAAKPGFGVRAELRHRYLLLSRDALGSGVDPAALRRALLLQTASGRGPLMLLLLAVASAFVLGALCKDGAHRALLGSRCLLQNNFFVMEVARPPTDCRVCRGVDGVVVLTNATRETFARHAYAGRPVLVRGATAHWSASRTFSFDFFRRLYADTPGALDSVDDECQFFPFRTDFVSLRDVFAMPPEQAAAGAKPWYIGWSNCNPQVTEVLRKHYSRPSFLPEDSESSTIDWIFMGWAGQGASVHLDYVQRPSWQAQISGRKTWKMFPTPECEAVCTNFTITVEKGDIVLIDTNQWYHDTYIDPGEISITIGSEYD